MGPAAPRGTGYPVRKPICLTFVFAALNSHSGHRGGERCNLSMREPEKSKGLGIERLRLDQSSVAEMPAVSPGQRVVPGGWLDHNWKSLILH